MDQVSISALTFVDYEMSAQRGRMNIVKQQRELYEATDPFGSIFYVPIRSAMRSAVNSVDPAAVMASAMDAATQNGQAKAFAEIAAGFLPWLKKQAGVGVPVKHGAWASGGLSVSVRPDFGLRLPTGQLVAVLVYKKEPPLTRDAAYVGARLLEYAMRDVLQGGSALVLDARRGKSYRVPDRSSRTRLDALMAGEAAGYVVHWNLAA